MTGRGRGSAVLLIALVACAAFTPRDDDVSLDAARALLRRGAYDSAATASRNDDWNRWSASIDEG